MKSSSLSPSKHSSKSSKASHKGHENQNYHGSGSSSSKASSKDHEDLTVEKGLGEVPKNLVLRREPSIDINQSAEAFINKFKKQLLIQRLESIENYEQMLARGT